MTLIEHASSLGADSAGSEGPRHNSPVETEALMASGKPLPGTLTPIAEKDVPAELRDLSPADATLLPAGTAESIEESEKDFTFDSASGFDFPREHLDDDFFRRLAHRHAVDKEAGELGKFNLVIATEAKAEPLQG